MAFFLGVVNATYSFISQWWPWLKVWDDTFIIQFFVIFTLTLIYLYNSIYYVLLYTFTNFFLVGIYLATFQIELFTAFLWLIECSVLFIFLLLLFYLNVKNTHAHTFSQNYSYIFVVLTLIFCFLVDYYAESDSINVLGLSIYGLVDNYYEALCNAIQNDLFGFSVSYFTINGVELSTIGFLLLVGSVICVNLYKINKGVQTQAQLNYLTIFNFFTDLSEFFFLRKQNVVKQGATKASTKVFKKK